MNITKEHIKVLNKVKKLIQSEKEFYICHALENIRENNPQYETICSDLVNWVDRQLGPCMAYGSWLIRSYPWHKFDDYQERQGRIAWIEHMIKLLEYELRVNT